MRDMPQRADDLRVDTDKSRCQKILCAGFSDPLPKLSLWESGLLPTTHSVNKITTPSLELLEKILPFVPSDLPQNLGQRKTKLIFLRGPKMSSAGRIPANE
jgi:hypothetical protein